MFVRLALTFAGRVRISYVLVEQFNSDIDFARLGSIRTVQRPRSSVLSSVLCSRMQSPFFLVFLEVLCAAAALRIPVLDGPLYETRDRRLIGYGFLVQSPLFVLFIFSLELLEQLLHFNHTTVFVQVIDLLLPTLTKIICLNSVVDQVLQFYLRRPQQLTTQRQRVLWNMRPLAKHRSTSGCFEQRKLSVAPSSYLIPCLKGEGAWILHWLRRVHREVIQKAVLLTKSRFSFEYEENSVV